MRPVLAGRVGDWRTLAVDWTDDRAAFVAFIDERIRPGMLQQMAKARAVQARLRKSPTLSGAFAAMWREGIHPLQTEADDSVMALEDYRPGGPPPEHLRP